MDEALEKALEFSNFTATLNGQKRILHEKYLDDLVLYYGNGKFSISKETLNFAHMLISSNINNTILVDDNKCIVIRKKESIDDLMKNEITQELL